MEKQISVFGWSEIRRLLKTGSGPHITIYLPLHDEWSEGGADSRRLSHLLSDVEQTLRNGGLRPDEAQQILSPARDFSGTDDHFRANGATGLALFLASGVFRYFYLSVDVEEMVNVSGQFLTRKLMEQLSSDGRFFVLALSRENVRLFEGGRYVMEQIEMKDTPTSMDEALQYEEFEKHTGAHAGQPVSRGAGDTQQSQLFHGGGAWADRANVKPYLRRFLQAVDNGVRDALEGESAPLVHVGLSQLRGIYREVNNYRFLHDQDVDHNPDRLAADEIHDLAWPQVETAFQEATKQAEEQFERLMALAPERIADNAERAAEAAFVKRVDTLILPTSGSVWGSIDPGTGVARTVNETQPRIDLLDFAAGQTLLAGGRVFTVDASSIPGGCQVAAILRY